MARPRPATLLSRTDPKTFRAEQILEAQAIYAVFYDGLPINLRSIHTMIDGIGPKYKKVAFSNPGHAHNLRDRLNTLFKTDQFVVYRLTTGEPIHETGE